MSTVFRGIISQSRPVISHLLSVRLRRWFTLRRARIVRMAVKNASVPGLVSGMLINGFHCSDTQFKISAYSCAESQRRRAVTFHLLEGGGRYVQCCRKSTRPDGGAGSRPCWRRPAATELASAAVGSVTAGKAGGCGGVGHPLAWRRRPVCTGGTARRRRKPGRRPQAGN